MSAPSYAQWQRQCPLPPAESRMLIQEVLGCTHAQTVSRSAETVPQNILLRLNRLAERRADGEPMAYILGRRDFYGRSFAVSPATLIPRPETEQLLEAAIARLPHGGRLWDLGTGSGIIAVSAKLERPDADIYASDASPAALAQARENAQRLGAAVRFGQGSWYQAFPAEAPFDVLVSNPPYIEADDPHLSRGDLRFEPADALTDHADGLRHLHALILGASGYLKARGWLLLEHGFNQGAAVRALLQQHGFKNTATLTDLAGLERISLGSR